MQEKRLKNEGKKKKERWGFTFTDAKTIINQNLWEERETLQRRRESEEERMSELLIGGTLRREIIFISLGNEIIKNEIN